jgi:signal transduction histidine kinase
MTDPRRISLVTLLIEDNAADAELIAIRLESAVRDTDPCPIYLLHATSVQTGCALLRRERVDAVILDLALPDARGLEAVHRVRLAAAGVPVIVLTGVADQEMAIAALRAGAQDYVLKPPPDGGSLSRIIHYACERQRLLQELDGSVHASALAERQWRLLCEVSAALALSPEIDPAVERVARVLVPEIADSFVLFLAGKKAPGGARHWHLRGDSAPALRDGLKRLLVRFGPDDLQSGEWRQEIAALFEAAGLASGSAVPLHVDGRVRGLLLLGASAERREGPTDETFAFAVADRIDMTISQTRLLRRTQRAVAARDRAVSIVSHDLRNPIATIQICARALLEPEPPTAAGVRQMGDLVLRSAAWMQQIVEELLDRATLDAGRLALHRVPTDVTGIMSAAQAMFATAARINEVELELSSDPQLPLVQADAHRLTQVLANLLGNAIKFTPPGGRVRLSAEAVRSPLDARESDVPERHIRFSVSDTGRGISAEDLRHVFDWFWHTQSDTRSGVGLGLSIARGIVEAHRGRLHVESTPGRGSTFSFTLPIAVSGFGIERSRSVLPS